MEAYLRSRGVLAGSVPIDHKELLKNRDLFDSLSPVEHEHINYLRYKERIKTAYRETGDWDKVISSGAFYSDPSEGNESFIDYIEELYQVQVRDAKHLRELLGLKENTPEELEDILTGARYSKYSTALQIAIEKGAKYKDLLQIQPKEYGLPETWDIGMVKDQYTAILWGIYLAFILEEPQGVLQRPGLREIARELEAPYSVIMDALKIAR